jgi:dipeptide transport system substrate-binding protein
MIWRLGLILVATGVTAHAQAILPDKTLVYCSEGSPTGFDPSQSTSLTDATVTEAIYNNLVQFDLESLKVKPSLATDWRISPDGRIYTFHLRRGVKFHTTPWFKPRRTFNADDVLFTFERMHNPQMPFQKAYPTVSLYYFYTGLDKIIKSIEAPDPYTVRFTLNTPHAPFLSNLADSSTAILSAEYAAQLLKAGKPAEINQKPVGTGPFIFHAYEKDAKIILVGNRQYWHPDDVQLSRLIFAITPDTVVRSAKLKKNECQVSIYPHPIDIAVLQTDPDFLLLSQLQSMSYVAYNTEHKPLGDVRVRRALDMAIDKQAIIQSVYEGHAQVAVAPLLPFYQAYDNNLKDAPRDLKQAQALLAQAGYPDGLSLRLLISTQNRPYNPNPKLMAEMIQADWAKIGVKAKIVIYEFGALLARARRGEHDAILMGSINVSNDPDEWFADLRCGQHMESKWCAPLFDNAVQQARQTTEMAKRTAFYLQAQQIFKREQPLTPIAYPLTYQPISKNVTHFKMNPFAAVSFAGVGIHTP